MKFDFSLSVSAQIKSVEKSMFKLLYIEKDSYIWAYPFEGMFFIGRCRVEN